MESLLIIELTMFLCAALVQTTLHDDAVKELNTMILEEIQLKREALDKLKEDTSNSRIGLSLSSIPYPATKKSGIPLSLTPGFKSRKSLTRTDKKKFIDSIDEAVEKKEIGDILLKRSIREEIMKTDKIDAIVNAVYDKLKKKSIADTSIIKDFYHVLDSASISAIPPKGPTKDVESKYDVGPPGLWGKDEMNGPPGLWGRDEVRGPPGLWGKRGEIERKYAKLNTARGPPGLWGREETKRRDERKQRKKFQERSSSAYRPPTLWRKEVDKKTTRRRGSDIFT